MSKDTKPSTDQNVELTKVTAGITMIINHRDTSLGQVGKTSWAKPGEGRLTGRRGMMTPTRTILTKG